MTKQERIELAKQKAMELKAKKMAELEDRIMSSEAYLIQLSLQEQIDEAQANLEAMKIIITDYNEIVSKDKESRLFYTFGYSKLIDITVTTIVSALYAREPIKDQLKALIPVTELTAEQVVEAFPRLPYFSTDILTEMSTIEEVEASMKAKYEVPSAKEINRVMELVSIELDIIIPPVTQFRCDALYNKKLAEQLALAKATIEMNELDQEMAELQV